MCNRYFIKIRVVRSLQIGNKWVLCLRGDFVVAGRLYDVEIVQFCQSRRQHNSASTYSMYSISKQTKTRPHTVTKEKSTMTFPYYQSALSRVPTASDLCQDIFLHLCHLGSLFHKKFNLVSFTYDVSTGASSRLHDLQRSSDTLGQFSSEGE